MHPGPGMLDPDVVRQVAEADEVMTLRGPPFSPEPERILKILKCLSRALGLSECLKGVASPRRPRPRIRIFLALIAALLGSSLHSDP